MASCFLLGPTTRQDDGLELFQIFAINRTPTFLKGVVFNWSSSRLPLQAKPLLPNLLIGTRKLIELGADKLAVDGFRTRVRAKSP
jgi:hypothetical protein